VVDNASSDNSLEVVEEIARRHPELSIRLIELRRNLGYGRAVNIGALNARFDLILASNNDIIFHPKYLENLYETYCRAKRLDEKVVAAQGLHMYYPEVNCINNSGTLFSILSGTHRFDGVCLTRDDFSKVMKWAREGRTGFSYIAFPSGAGALIEREIFLRVGGYYRLYFSGMEDEDLGLLLYLLGYRMIFAPSAVLYHMESYTLGGRSFLVPRKLYFSLTGLFIYMLSLYNAKALVKGLVSYVIAWAFLTLISLFIKNKYICLVLVKTWHFNLKAYNAILNRRIRISIIKRETLDKIIEYLDRKGKYVELPRRVYIFIRHNMF